MVGSKGALAFDLIGERSRFSSLISSFSPPGLTFVWFNPIRSHHPSDSFLTYTKLNGNPPVAIAGLVGQNGQDLSLQTLIFADLEKISLVQPLSGNTQGNRHKFFA